MDRLVFHVDVNSAFLSWEAVRRLANGDSDLRLVPAAVGGPPEKRTSVVLAKSIPAKKYGIETGEPVRAALQKCPELTLVPPDFAWYGKCSRAFKDICRLYAPAVEEFSIDECFLDMSGTKLLYPDPVKTAAEIKDRIKNELGFTVNIGIGPNKLLAKVAGDFEKPDKVHTLMKEELETKYWPLPCESILFCGKATAARLRLAGIRTVGELAKSEPGKIRQLLGEKQGQLMHDYALGLDDSPVRTEREEPKGFSNEVTFEEDLTDTEEGRRVLLSLADSVGYRIRKEGVRAFCVCVTVRGGDMKKKSHRRTLFCATDSTTEIYGIAAELLAELWNGEMPIRLMGLGVTELEKKTEGQLTLFEKKNEKEEKADRAADLIREKFGRKMIARGAIMEDDHNLWGNRKK